MLFGKALKNAEGYSQKHLRCPDYYEKGKSVEGEWMGLACAEFGVSEGAKVLDRDFESLRKNQHAKTTRQITQRHNTTRLEWTVRKTPSGIEKFELKPVSNRRVAFDFTLSMPKTFSILGVTAGDARVWKWHDKAVRKTFREMERLAARWDSKGGRKILETTGKVAAARYDHPCNRSLEPNVHSHLVIFNATPGSDGKYYGLQERVWMDRAKYLTGIYRDCLASEARKAGMELSVDRFGAPQLKSIEDLIPVFSQRANDIHAMVETVEEIAGTTLNAAEVKRLVFASRGLDLDKFSRSWQIKRAKLESAFIDSNGDQTARRRLLGAFEAIVRDCSDGGLTEISTEAVLKMQRDLLDPEQLARLDRFVHRTAKDDSRSVVKTTDSVNWAVQHLFERLSVVRDHDILAAALNYAQGSDLDLAELREILAKHPDLIIKGGEVTTKTHLKRETEILQWIADGKQKGVRLPKVEKSKLNSHQLTAVNNLLNSDEQFTVLCGKAGVGKCLGKGTIVLKYDGEIVPVEQIKDGDLLMGDDSKPRKVTGSKVGFGRLFKIIPTNGDAWICNDNHIMTLKYCGSRSRRKRKNIGGKCIYHPSGKRVPVTRPAIRDVCLSEFLGKLPVERRVDSAWKLMRSGIDWKENSISKLYPVRDFYFFGLWLGDGCVSGGLNIHNPDIEIRNWLRQYAERNGWLYKEVKEYDTKLSSYRVSMPCGTPGYHPAIIDLKAFGFGSVKTIPLWAKTAPREKRLALLAGLLDADGHLTCNCFEITQKLKDLADSICFIARSLGMWSEVIKCIKGCQTGARAFYYRQHISGNTDMIPTLVDRKKATARQQKKDVKSVGWKVKPAGIGDYYGFELDGNGRFLLGDFTVTHNTQSLESFIGANVQAGHRVIALAPSTKSRDVIPHHARHTLQRFLVDKAKHLTVRPNDLVIVDEAGFASVEQIHKLMSLARGYSWRVCLCGDDRQHSSVESGDALHIILHKSSVKREWMDRILRQKAESLDGRYLKACKFLSRGQTTQAFAILDRAGAIHVAKGQDRIDQIADLVMAKRKEGLSIITVCATHRECDRINQAIRDRMKKDGLLGEERTISVLRNVQWTLAERQQISRLRPGLVIEIVQGPGRGQGWKVVRVEQDKAFAIRNGQTRLFDAKSAELWQVTEERQIHVAIGDRLISHTGIKAKGSPEVVSGEEFIVAGFDDSDPRHACSLRTSSGKVISSRNLSHCHAVTSPASQGTTSDGVIFSVDRASVRWIHQKIPYVGISRGREFVAVFCESKSDLLQVEGRSGDRVSSLELVHGSAKKNRFGIRV